MGVTAKKYGISSWSNENNLDMIVAMTAAPIVNILKKKKINTCELYDMRLCL